MRALLLAALACLSCATDKEKPLLPAVDPGERFLNDVETKLLRAKTVHLKGTATSTGAVNAALAFELWLGAGQRAHLDVKGTFEGRPVTTWFICDGTSMKVRGAATTAAAPEVRDAMVIGLVRMGLLHNAALLVGGASPDHAEGRARDWVKAERARAGEPATEIRFDVVVKHDVMGDAVLTLDASESPVKRSESLHFEEGDMTDDEKYEVVELDAPVDDAVFSLAP